MAAGLRNEKQAPAGATRLFNKEHGGPSWAQSRKSLSSLARPRVSAKPWSELTVIANLVSLRIPAQSDSHLIRKSWLLPETSPSRTPRNASCRKRSMRAVAWTPSSTTPASSVAKPFTVYIDQDYANLLRINLDGFLHVTPRAAEEMRTRGSVQFVQ